MDFTNSMKYLERAKKVIPVCSQTFSKGPNYFPIGSSPLFLERGQGAHVWDVDGQEYIDYIMGLGPITLGYNYPAVNDAIITQLHKGPVFSMPSPLEVELSEKIVDIIPCAEMVRFVKTGSEATQAAIRAARAYTGRRPIAYRGYHGWHSWYSCQTERNGGTLPQEKNYIHRFEYNDLASLESIFDKHHLAAVIMEPMIVEPPEPGFLEDIRKLCDVYGALLIFDEVVTGFRWTLGGAQEYFNVTPDLATFGKGMANGLPLACIVGKRDIMNVFEDIFVSSTQGGECLSLAASLATIESMIYHETIEHCWGMGARLTVGLEKIGIPYKGFPCRPILALGEKDNPPYRSLLMQELNKRGVLIHNGMLLNLCASHTIQDIDFTIAAFDNALKAIDHGAILEGQVVKTAFKRL